MDNLNCSNCKFYCSGSIKIYNISSSVPSWDEYNGICFRLAIQEGIAEPIYVNDGSYCPYHNKVETSNFKVFGAFCSSF